MSNMLDNKTQEEREKMLSNMLKDLSEIERINPVSTQYFSHQKTLNRFYSYFEKRHLNILHKLRSYEINQDIDSETTLKLLHLNIEIELLLSIKKDLVNILNKP